MENNNSSTPNSSTNSSINASSTTEPAPKRRPNYFVRLWRRATKFPKYHGSPWFQGSKKFSNFFFLFLKDYQNKNTN